MFSDMIKSRAKNFLQFFRQRFERYRLENVHDREATSNNCNSSSVDQTDKCLEGSKSGRDLDMERFLLKGDEILKSAEYRKFLFSLSDSDSGEEDGFEGDAARFLGRLRRLTGTQAPRGPRTAGARLLDRISRHMRDLERLIPPEDRRNP